MSEPVAQAQVISASPSGLSPPAFLAIGSMLTLSMIAVLLFFFPIPDKNAQLAGAVIGYIAALATGAAGYYFTSTASSKVKDDTISTMARTGTGSGTGQPPGTTTTTTSTTSPAPAAAPAATHTGQTP